jgi:hypothetical protein
MLPRMVMQASKRLLVVNVVLAGTALFFAVSLVRDLTRVRPLPPPPAPRQARALPPAEQVSDSAAAEEKLAGYNVIAAKHLFNPSRTESGAAAAAPVAPRPPKPLLLGVVVDGPQSRAYLEDPSTKRVLGYWIGDTVAGGRLEKVTHDGVVIVRPDGPMEVMLRDPSKPKAAPPTPTAATPSAGQAAPPAGSAPGAEGQLPQIGGRGGRGGGGRSR